MATPLIIGPLGLASPVVLAPMAGYTDLVYRLLIRSLGGLGLAYTEMLNPQSVLHGGGRKRQALLATSPADHPLGHQLYGTDPSLMAEAARWLVARGARLIDINMGCPQKKISRRGAGAGLLRNPPLAVKLAQEVVAAVPVPVTAKLRLGWDARSLAAAQLAAELEQIGIAAITVHARTGVQQYAGAADWPEIRRVVASVKKIPVIGNGDVTTPQAALDLQAETGCTGIMIGRAALKNPWIIRQTAAALAGQTPAREPNWAERRNFVCRHLDAMAGHYGERAAVLLFRRWLPQYARTLHWPRETTIPLLQIIQTESLRQHLRRLEAPV